MMDSYTTFLLQCHLLLIVAFELSFKDLLRFRHLPGFARMAFNTEITRRIFRSLNPFIPTTSAPTFFARLEECGGIITGSIVREILLLNIKTLETFTTLTIIIRHRAPSPMQKFLKQLGYAARDLTQKDPEAKLVDLRDGKNVVESVELYERVDNSGTVGVSDYAERFPISPELQKFSIVLLVCKREPVSLLVSCDNTADMVAISRNTIVAYYPRLTFADEGLFVNDCVDVGSYQMEITTGDGSTLYSDNSHWKKPCGIYCPSIWRHSYDDDGVLTVNWECPREVTSGAGVPETQGTGVGSGSPVSGGVVSVEASSEGQGAERYGDSPEGKHLEPDVGSSDGEEDQSGQGAEDCDSSPEGKRLEPDVRSSDGEEDRSGERLGLGEGAEPFGGSSDAGNWGVVSAGGSAGSWGADVGWQVADAWRPEKDVWRQAWRSSAPYFDGNIPSLNNFTYGEIFRWRVTNRCKNGECPNSQLHDVLLEYGVLL